MNNTQKVKKLYELFGERNIPGILDMLSDKVVFEDSASLWIDGKPHLVPFTGTYKGKENIGKFFQKMGETTEITKFEPKKYFENGNDVIALCNLAGKFRESGISGESTWVMLWTFDGDKVISSRVTTMPGTV